MKSFAKRMKAGAITAIKVGSVAGILMLIGMAATVQYTSQSEFCNSCHIMEPYYKSWQDSPHASVACVDCHYEPGMLETATGKFKAVSQLAKYVTATQGTKPWAEVSDQSCMRSGCHSERLISGPLDYGRIKFDHRHHLLETRRGRRLRCTSCHAQDLKKHIGVTPASCFLCHFRASEESASHGECMTCHGPPREEIVVGELTFRHSDYTDRGVTCDACHRNVTRGEGLARKNRCAACHPLAEHVDRLNETEFIHEHHIAIHKVECIECHDEIQHGLLDRHESADPGECRSCHGSRHGPQWDLYAGRGAKGVPPKPSPMYTTRVDCAACHQGYWDAKHEKSRTVAGSTAVSCMYCHGHGFSGMLMSWQREFDKAIPALEARLRALEQSLEGKQKPAGLEQARHNLDFVKSDGSRGAHNIHYVLTILRSIKNGIDEAGKSLDTSYQLLELDVGVPVALETTCANSCHVDVARLEPRFGGVVFKHRPHLVSEEMDCDACHSLENHGQTTMPPADCTSCHHGSEKPACVSCHDREQRLFEGSLTLPGKTVDLENPHASGVECSDCHIDLKAKDQPAVVRKQCIECHDEDRGETLDEWLEIAKEGMSDIEKRLATLRPRIAAAPAEKAGPAHALFATALASYEAVRDGIPVHNIMGADALLTAVGEVLDDVEKILGR